MEHAVMFSGLALHPAESPQVQWLGGLKGFPWDLGLGNLK